MEKVLATFHKGNVEFDVPPHWPEGTRLEIVPTRKTLGLNESEWPTTAEEKRKWLEWLDSLEPFDMTPQELDAFEADLNKSKETQQQLLRESWEREDAS